jgi:Leucine-rich repeat (LRR) protein
MKNLTRLDVSDNLITALPDTLVKLKELRELNLSDNKIKSWPTNFVKIQTRAKVRTKSKMLTRYFKVLRAAYMNTGANRKCI